MIFYFSGTGNSRYAAQIIESVTKDKLISMNNLIKARSREVLHSEKPLVFVCPTYAWRIPKVVEKLMNDTQFSGNKNAYFVLTCGDGTGNAAQYAKKLCKEKGFTFLGLASVIMPENYIALYDAPDKAQAEVIIQRSTPEFFDIAKKIKDGQPLKESKCRLSGMFLSGMVNPIFYPLIVNAKGFYATDACIHCGKCVKLCPLNNIILKDGKPQWGRDCTHCMACICGCPSEAIEYKRHTQGKPRYSIQSL